MGVGGRGKCPGAPSHHLRKGKKRKIVKSGRPKGTVKSRMAKNGKAIKKKKIKWHNCSLFLLRFFNIDLNQLSIVTHELSLHGIKYLSLKNK
jgi:hypothetical protein